MVNQPARRNKVRLYIPSKDRQGKGISNRKVATYDTQGEGNSD